MSRVRFGNREIQAEALTACHRVRFGNREFRADALTDCHRVRFGAGRGGSGFDPGDGDEPGWRPKWVRLARGPN